MAVDFPPTIRFSQLVRPPTMRSLYWRFFGFPATADGQIITRQKIICTLCNGEVAYNRNTTNLKGHLKNRHRGVIEAAQQQEPLVKRVKYVYQPVDDDGQPLRKTVTAHRQCSSHPQSPDRASVNEADINNERDNDEDDQLQEFVVFAESPKLRRRLVDVIDVDNTAADDINLLFVDEQRQRLEQEAAASADEDTTKFGYMVEYIKCEVDSASGHETDTEPSESVTAGADHSDEVFLAHQQKTMSTSTSTTDRLIDVLVENMLPSEFVASKSFEAFCAAIDDRYRLPSAHQIETALGRRYADGRTKALDALSSHLLADDDRNYFSIGVERWTNHSQNTYLTVYVFHVTTGDATQPNGRFATTTLHTLAWQRSHSADAWSTLFAPLPLANCTAMLLNFPLAEHPVLRGILDANNIAALFCLHHAIGEAARRCLDIVDARDGLPSSSSSCVAPDDPDAAAYWHTRFDRLQADGNGDDIDALLRLLEPLRVAEQTVMAERTPIASLVHPIVQQLLQNHFAVASPPTDASASDLSPTAIETQIRRQVHETFVELGLVYHPVSLAASLLDPRFQNLIDGGQDLPAIRQSLRKLSATPTERLDDAAAACVRADKTATGKPSKLSAFLRPHSRPDRTTVLQRRSRLDVELDAYVADVDAELEQCPLAWWRTVGRAAYGQLEACARRYLCVPAVLPRGRISEAQQRPAGEQRSVLRGDDARVARSVWLLDELRGRWAAQ